MNKSLFRLQVLPFLAQFILLIGATLVSDFILHQFDLVWVGRYLGIPGTFFILLSLFYSLRKRKVIRSGNPRVLLKMHEIFTWLGALMVLVHAGVHFNAILPWLALGAMVINVISGMIGQYLLNRSKQHLKGRKAKYKMHGLSKTETEKELFWDAVTFDLMAKWRVVHFPISYAFAVLGIGHILSIFLFWGWK
ncbi:hypothetical protein GCM10011332_33210 [Terasakiella brassicae]|jgi:hypothetical protein|uniref:Uncharacterized protein n=1 Tax=Terasakiella brassicae TaxID=1634917 RepID=A0A917C7U9_9PROT|nr:hypothetical protein [Terasakiella brassicae]GGF76564.1 hypothetical protein GCM10011332_33210 [Terasakiella brassicae]